MKTWTTPNGVQIIRILEKRCNCYLVRYRGQNILVDTSRRVERKGLKQALDMLGVDRLALIVITHCHFDHTENLAFAQERFKAPVAVHDTESQFLEQGENAEIHGTIFPTRLLIGAMNQFGIYRRFRYRPVQADIRVRDRHDLGTMGFPAYLLHTPGHTRGSMSLIVDDDTAIVGDAMFGIIKQGLFPPFGADNQGIIRTWKTLLDTGCSRFLPAHGRSRPRAIVEKNRRRRMVS